MSATVVLNPKSPSAFAEGLWIKPIRVGRSSWQGQKPTLRQEAQVSDKNDPIPKPRIRQTFYGSLPREFYPHGIGGVLAALEQARSEDARRLNTIVASLDQLRHLEGIHVLLKLSHEREKRMEQLMLSCLKNQEALLQRLSQVGHAGIPTGSTSLPTGRRQRSETENYHNMEPFE